MRSEFFQQQIERLRGIYSPGALNQERIDVWWKRFRNEPDHVFENALNHVIAEATSQQLPAMSRVAEALGFFRTNATGASMQVLPPAHDCERCRDFGFLFSGHTVVACNCDRGRRVNPERLAMAQKSYDKGRAMFRSPYDAGMPPPNGERIFSELPYDPNERFGGGA